MVFVNIYRIGTPKNMMEIVSLLPCHRHKIPEICSISISKCFNETWLSHRKFTTQFKHISSSMRTPNSICDTIPIGYINQTTYKWNALLTSSYFWGIMYFFMLIFINCCRSSEFRKCIPFESINSDRFFCFLSI